MGVRFSFVNPTLLKATEETVSEENLKNVREIADLQQRLIYSTMVNSYIQDPEAFKAKFASDPETLRVIINLIRQEIRLRYFFNKHTIAAINPNSSEAMAMAAIAAQQRDMD